MDDGQLCGTAAAVVVVVSSGCLLVGIVSLENAAWM